LLRIGCVIQHSLEPERGMGCSGCVPNCKRLRVGRALSTGELKSAEVSHP
jgi:hypothetical protein